MGFTKPLLYHRATRAERRPTAAGPAVRSSTSESDSTSSRFAHKAEKPNEPYPPFPLFAHAAGVWAKKIRGELHDSGKWGDSDGALKKYEEQKDALHAGRGTREDAGRVTVKNLCNVYFNHKQSRLDNAARRSLATRTRRR